MADEIQFPQLPFLTREMLTFGKQASLGLRATLLMANANPVELRGITRAGEFTYSATPSGDFALQTFDFAIPDIPIFVATAIPEGAGEDNSGYAMLQLTVNGEPMIALGQGQISQITNLSWPTQPSASVEQRRGRVHLFEPDDPVAGAEIDFDISNRVITEILWISFTLVADSNVANRTVRLRMQHTAGELNRTAGTDQQADEEQVYQFVPGGTTQVISADEEQEIALPSPLGPLQGPRIRTVTTNRQAGDQFESITILARVEFTD